MPDGEGWISRDDSVEFFAVVCHYLPVVVDTDVVVGRHRWDGHHDSRSCYRCSRSLYYRRSVMMLMMVVPYCLIDLIKGTLCDGLHVPRCALCFLLCDL